MKSMSSDLDCEKLLSEFDYEEDVRRPPDNLRKGQFRAGWKRETIREEKLRRELTWHNLGYRVGKLCSHKSEDEINEIYEQFARHYSNR
jgi:hypothetical protein